MMRNEESIPTSADINISSNWILIYFIIFTLLILSISNLTPDQIRNDYGFDQQRFNYYR